MRGRARSEGYTIIEVMIFLAISGFMFLLAAVFISGKQQRAQFRQGMEDINTQIQTVMNDVTNGFYPSNSNFTCTAGVAGGLSFGTPNPGQGGQGTNVGCVFLGKVMQFGAQQKAGAGVNDNTRNYNVFTVAGRQYIGSGPELPTGFDDSNPTPVTPDAGGVAAGTKDLTQYNVLQWGLQVKGMYMYDPTDTGLQHPAPIGAIGFFGSFANYGAAALSSGSQTTTVAYVPGSALNQKTTDLAPLIKNIKDADVLTRPNIVVCFANGKDYGSITIGANNGQRLSTDPEMDNSSVPEICRP